MKVVRARLASVVVISLTALMLLASPAGAATPVVVANQKFKWFYWIGPFLAAGLLFWLLLVAVGYYIRVLRSKWRGRQPSS